MTFTGLYELCNPSQKEVLLEDATALLVAALRGVEMVNTGENSVYSPQHPASEAAHTLLTLQFVRGQLSKLACQKAGMAPADYQCAVDELREKKAGHLLYWCDLVGHKPRPWCPCCQRYR